MSFVPKTLYLVLSDRFGEVKIMDTVDKAAEMSKSITSKDINIGQYKKADVLISKLLFEGLSDDNGRISGECAMAIPFLAEEYRTPLIVHGLSSEKPYLRLKTAMVVESVPKEDYKKVIELLENKILEGLESEKYLDKAYAIEMIEFMPEEKRQMLFDKAMNYEDEFHSIELEIKSVKNQIQRHNEINPNIGIIDNYEKEDFILDKKKVVKESEEKKLYEFASKTPLYDRFPDKFKREIFKGDTDYGTTLLGELDDGVSLKNQVIIRHLNLECFLNWRKAFESNIWSKLGFKDYIPVEPIIRIGDNPSLDKVDVYTGVIRGPSAYDWIEKTDLYKDEIMHLLSRIQKGFKILNIEHNHLKKHNIVLEFHRNEEGKVDLTRVPRAYVIDFDLASKYGGDQD